MAPYMTRHRNGMSHSDYIKRVVNAWPAGYVSIDGFCRRVGLCRTTVNKLIKSGALEEPALITPQKKGWTAEYVNQWIATRPAAA